MKTSSELRFFSLQKLNGSYGPAVAVTVTVLAINLVFSFFVEMIVQPSNIFSYAAYEVVCFLANLLLGVLISGQAYFFMNIVYGKEAHFSDLSAGWKEHPEKAILLRIPFALAGTLATAPINIYVLFLKDAMDRNVLFVCMLLATAGGVIEVLLEIVYAQVLYLLHDFPDRSVTDLFRASARLMDGHKGQYFLLVLSYLPLLVAGVMLFFIPALFVMSQLNAVQAAFYQALVGPKREAEPPAAAIRYR